MPDNSTLSRVLMFSGGRDSTLAACRLVEDGRPIVLVTVTSPFLRGLGSVRKRLVELKPILPRNTIWCVLSDEQYPSPSITLGERTCLPCHMTYGLAGIATAKHMGIDRLAFGYVQYQSTWPEQQPYAVSAFSRILDPLGIALELPVYGLQSKQAAVSELESLGLSVDALEQKCSRQITNVTIEDGLLRSAIDEWSISMEQALHSPLAPPQFTLQRLLGEIDA